MPVSDAGTPMSPAWHPNGRMIAYATYQPAGISVLDLVERPRADAGERAGGVHLARSSRRTARASSTRTASRTGVDLYTASLSGGGGRRLSVGRGSDNVSPSFSPDGRRIAFMSGRAGHPEIYTMDADGTNVDLLTPLDFGENRVSREPRLVARRPARRVPIA